jgi:hypothetical protein
MGNTAENTELEVFGTKEVSVKEFMGLKDKSLVVLSDYELAKSNLLSLREKHEARVEELVSIEKLSPSELKELNGILSEIRKPRYLIQNLKKDNASVFAAYSKNDKLKWDDLIEINEPIEDKASDKVKIEDERKKNEKLEEQRIEQERVNGIKAKIDSFETDSYNVINKTTIEDVEYSRTILDAMVNVEFDYEEFDILFEKAKQRVQQTWDLKCNEIQEKEAQRKRTGQLEQEAAEAKRLSDLQASRLKELLPYNSFGAEVDMTTLSDLSELDYNAILAEKKSLFEADAKEKQEAKEKLEAENLERENKAKAEKEAINIIRKNRLAEIGVLYDSVRDYFRTTPDEIVALDSQEVFNASTLEFEEIIINSKKLIQEFATKLETDKQAKLEAENLEKEKQAQLLKDNEDRKERLFGDKTAISISLDKIKDIFISEIAYTQYDNEETETFRKSLEVKFDSLFTECLTDLDNL